MDRSAVRVNEHFWDPVGALERRMREVVAFHERVVRVVEGAEVRGAALLGVPARARAVVAGMPAVVRLA